MLQRAAARLIGSFFALEKMRLSTHTTFWASELYPLLKVCDQNYSLASIVPILLV